MKRLQMLALAVVATGFAPLALAHSDDSRSDGVPHTTPAPSNQQADSQANDSLRSSASTNMPASLGPTSHGHPAAGTLPEGAKPNRVRAAAWQALLPGSIQ